MYLKITEEMEKQIEKWWNKPLKELTDVDAITIVEEFARVDNVKYAWFSTDDEIYYEEYEEPDEDDVAPGWNERYLNYIGMSMKDFV